MANNRKEATFPSSSNITITLASLASSLTAGRQSNEIDNSTNLYLDYLISAMVTTGTSPTAGRIEIWAIAQLDDSTYPDVITGAGDANKTWTTADIKAGAAVLLDSLVTDGTSNQKYYMGQVSLKSFFGGTCPKRFVIFVCHNTVAALNATGTNHQLTVQGSYENLNA